jgi:LuxR family maltose regulon positive regulatory protein
MVRALFHNNIIVLKEAADPTIFRCYRFIQRVARKLFDNRYPDRARDLYRKASVYYENKGLFMRAVFYAMEANDHERATGLVEVEFWNLFTQGNFLILSNYLSSMQKKDVENNLYLIFIFLFRDAYYNQTDSARSLIERAERVIDIDKNDGERMYDMRLDAMLYSFKAILHSQTGEVKKCVQNAEKALSSSSVNNIFLRSITLLGMGTGLAQSRAPMKSITSLRQAVLDARLDNYIDIASLATYHMTQEYLLQGQMTKAKDELERTVALIEDHGGDQFDDYRGILYGPLGGIEWERNNLSLAEAYLEKGIESVRELRSLEHYCKTSVYLSHLRYTQKRNRESLDVLEDALVLARRYMNDRATAIMEAHLAYLHAKLGYTSLTNGWIHRYREDERHIDTPKKELEQLTYSYILISECEFEEALVMIDTILHEAQATHHNYIAMRAHLQKALASYQMGSVREAYAAFDAVFDLSKEEGYIRTIIDESNALLDFLLEYSSFKSFPAGSLEQEYLDALIRASADEALPSPHSKRILKLLSKREQKVYLLNQQGFTNRQISEQLFISQETVKSHRKSINRKLEVATRNDNEDLRI